MDSLVTGHAVLSRPVQILMSMMVPLAVLNAREVVTAPHKQTLAMIVLETQPGLSSAKVVSHFLIEHLSYCVFEVNGRYSEWSCSPQDSCPDPSVNDGTILTISCSRTCDSPSPANGGLDCADPDGDTRNTNCDGNF